jgi:hypothetical protein
MGSTPKLNLDRFAATKTEMNTPEVDLRTATLAK